MLGLSYITPGAAFSVRPPCALSARQAEAIGLPAPLARQCTFCLAAIPFWFGKLGTSQAAFLPPLRLWSDGVTIPFRFVSIGLELRLSTHSGTALREATTTITVGPARSMMSLTSPTSSGTTS